MATSKKSSGKGRTNKKSSNKARTSSARNQSTGRAHILEDSKLRTEVKLIIMIGITILFEISAFGGCGKLGYGLGFFLFGMVGLIGYIFPALLFVGLMFLLMNITNRRVVLKVIFSAALTLFVCALIQMFTRMDSGVSVGSLFTDAGYYKHAGGLLGGLVALALFNAIGKVGAYIVIIVAIIVFLILITEKSLFEGLKNGGKKVYDYSNEEMDRLKESSEERRLRREQMREERRRQKELERQAEEERQKRLENENRRINNKGIGVPLNPLVSDENMVNDGMVEITADDLKDEGMQVETQEDKSFNFDNEFDNGNKESYVNQEEAYTAPAFEAGLNNKEKESENVIFDDSDNNAAEKAGESNESDSKEAKIKKTKKSGAYKYPPKSLLKKPERASNASNQELSETAAKLQQTLANFGVKVTITDVSQGPSVTRYEMQPEMGTKVSRITALADDIKLNLAAADIRIEAPIPGKAAVGIEVPNNSRNTVLLRELLESPELKNHPSKLAFAAGKDISGKVVVADIAKMPHMLVAGTTGSGKSVFTNSIIMTILYRAKPSEVKLLIVDPKVVEFGVYNGIPHLLHPVITDPKNAASALNWAVAEMTRRYQLLAEMNVRDFKGYNDKLDELAAKGEDVPEKMPQILIVIDELADLMMVAAKAVEESICRIAQLARAAGIHLIIATQRPSVDVVTGLIKANIPSRTALLVSSGTDSRTIIDMNGAEKLLGNGDMLFYPSGYVKPVRVQGAFVSDSEVANVVDFLKSNAEDTVYDESIGESIKSGAAAQNNTEGQTSNEDSGRDPYFADAGRLIIEMDKASSSMLQRRFRIGFNRAARIIDELYELGVIGPDEGSKARKVLMSAEEFEEVIRQ